MNGEVIYPHAQSARLANFSISVHGVHQIDMVYMDGFKCRFRFAQFMHASKQQTTQTTPMQKCFNFIR